MNTLGIYAVRDRLLDHLMHPFIGANDKMVMQGLSELINNKEVTHAIAQAPHHYELHKLGEIDEDGNVSAKRELICDASTLIRVERKPAERTDSAVQETSTGVNGAMHRDTATNERNGREI